MQWIKCKDRLPENDETILVYGIKEHNLTPAIHLGNFYKNVNGDEGNDQFWETGWGYDIEVTHWMLLPDAPKD